jgi:hypothetical protein
MQPLVPSGRIPGLMSGVCALFMGFRSVMTVGAKGWLLNSPRLSLRHFRKCQLETGSFEFIAAA